MRALDIIRDAYERCNRLSPSEVLSDDDIAFGLRRLNLLVDELSASNVFLYKDVLTSAVNTGNITLAAGAWASIPVGTPIVSATSSGVALKQITMQQYNELLVASITGAPSYYAHNGTDTVYLYPQPNGQTIKLQTREGLQGFADYLTDYVLLAGYESALGAALAVRIAPNIIGNVPALLLQNERALMQNIRKVDPAIINAPSFTSGQFTGVGVINGW